MSWAEITAGPDMPAGLGRYRHLVPFQPMKTVTTCPPATPSPLAQAAVGEIAATPVRSRSATCPPELGAGTKLHLAPFQCSVSGHIDGPRSMGGPARTIRATSV